MLWVIAENCISWVFTAIDSPHPSHNKPVFTFFNKTSSSSSPTFIHLFHKPLFKFLNNLSSLYSVTSLYFSTNLSFLFHEPFLTFSTNLVSQAFLHQYFFPRLTELSNYLSYIPFYLLTLTLLFILPTNPLIQLFPDSQYGLTVIISIFYVIFLEYVLRYFSGQFTSYILTTFIIVTL